MKKQIKGLLQGFGLDVVRHQHNRPDHNNAFYVQKSFFQDTPPSVILDVGAYKGDIALRYRNMFPAARIYAFEPFPDSFDLLDENVKGKSGIYPVNLALSNEAGTATFHSNASPLTNSLLATAGTGSTIDQLTKTEGSVKVMTQRLDNFMDAEGLDEIDLLKLDVQGGELKVLEGAGDLINEGKVKLIYSEVSFMSQYQGQPLFHELTNWLAEKNYDLYGVFNLCHSHTGQLIYGDAIYYQGDLRDHVNQLNIP